MQTPARSGQIDHARPRGRLSRHVRLATVASMLAALALPALAGSDALASATGSAASTTAMAKIAAAARVFEASHGNAAAKKKSKKKTKKKPKKAKLCVVKKRNKRGKLVAVFVTKTVTKRVKVGGRFVNRKVRVRVKKMAKCNKGPGSSSKPAGVPITITVVDPSAATLDFGAFQRTVALHGVIKGFIPGSYVQNQDNQIQISSGRVSLAPTGIFIDDVCNGQVSDSIRTNPASFAEVDPNTTGNSATLFASGVIQGLVHFRIQTSLDLRNDDGGCNQPYVSTGWTDLSVPLFVKGKLSFNQAQGGLISTLHTGQQVLDNLAACLAPGNPNLPCNGYAIPFPALFESTIVGVTTIG